MIELSDIQDLKARAAELERDLKRLAKLREKELADRESMTIKRRQKLAEDVNYLLMHIHRQELNLHVSAVNCGIAEAKEPSYYEPRTVKPNGWHDYRFTPDVPRSISAA